MKPSYFTIRFFTETVAIIASVEAGIMFLLPVIAPGLGETAKTSLDAALLTIVSGSLILWRMNAAVKRAGDTHRADERRQAPFSVRGLAVVLVLTLTLLTVAILVAMNQVAESRDDAALLEDLQGKVLVLDERLTMSARLAAATGDMYWEERYRVAEKDLDAVLKNIDALLDRLPGQSEEKARAAVASTSRYNDALIVLENQCFTLAKAGDPASAMAAVMSSDYVRLKGLYAQAAAEADAEADRLVDHARTQDRQFTFTIAWMDLMAAVVMSGLMVLSVSRSRGRAKALAAEMTKDLRASEACARAALAKLAAYRAALDQQTIIALTDDSGTITEVNEPICRASGYRREELIGANFRLLNSGHHPKEFWAQMWETIIRGDLWRAEVCNKAKDGSLYWLDSTIGPMRDEAGKIIGYVTVRIDITERKRSEDALREGEARYRSLFENMLNGFAYCRMIFEQDQPQDFIYLSVNTAFETLAGLNDVVGRKVSEVIPGIRETDPGLFEIYGRVARTGVPERFETYLKSLKMWFAISVYSPGKDHFVAVFDVITERKRAELELRQAHDNLESRVAKRTAQLAEAKDAAEAAARVKGEFLATMSHELRTPLNGVIGMMELLLRSKLSPQQRRHAWLAKSSGDMLLSLINDILDFSKIEAGRLELESTEFDLHYAIENLEACFSSSAASKGLELVCAIHPAVPRRVQGDPGRLQQVLTNLVGNAIKFTDQGEVAVRMTKDEENDHDVTVRFTVTDTGIGIPSERVERLFQSFSQIDSSTTRKYGGTGLGLAICKRLVEAMGGEIGVTSTEGCGATFWFIIKFAKQAELADQPLTNGGRFASGGGEAAPFVKGQPPSLPDDGAPNRRLPAEQCESSLPPIIKTQSSGGRILLAEDNEISQEVAATILRRAGFQCDVVSNGKEAVEAVRAAKCDLVLMDCQMPEMDGFQAAQAIRSFEQEHLLSGGPVKRIPIIALTANAIQGDRERCLAAGMDDYASKPLNSERLLRLIDAHLGNQGQAAVEPDPSESVTGETPPDRAVQRPSPAFDTEKMLKQWGNDTPFVQRLITKFCKRAPEDLGRLREAIERNDAGAAQRLAHGLKGAAGYVAAENVRQVAAQLEAMAREGDWNNTEACLSELAAELQRCADEAPNCSTGADIATPIVSRTTGGIR